MPRVHCRVARRLTSISFTLLLAACATQVMPAPKSLRGRDYPLLRVDGQPVRGVGAVLELPGSPSSRADCNDRVADGTLHVAADGRSFTYRSTMRRCSGEVLVTETNEGALEWRDSTLAFLIDESSGRVTFVGSWSDSTITIENFGGRLEFAKK